MEDLLLEIQIYGPNGLLFLTFIKKMLLNKEFPLIVN